MDHTFTPGEKEIFERFTSGKSEHALTLVDYFIARFQEMGAVTVHPHKTMISITRGNNGIAYITQLGKKFIHIVFPFYEAHENNMCFQRIQHVPGRWVIYHHLRMYEKDDLNEEVLRYMLLALKGK